MTGFPPDSVPIPSGIRTDDVQDSALNAVQSSQSSAVQCSAVEGSPDLRTSFSTREPGETNRIIRGITYADALVRVIAELRPMWDLDKVRHEVTTDPRPNGIAAPAAIFAACDRAIYEPGAISRYQPPTYTPPKPTPDIRAPKCPHGVLADPDGLGAGCDGCGTRAVPPPPGLAATLRRTA